MADVEIPGHLLEVDLPASVQIHRLADGRTQLIETNDPLHECCGILLLPWISRDGPGVSTLSVPPPAPFGPADLEQMWHARNEITSLRRPPTSGSAAWSRLERHLGPRIHWAALEAAVHAASALLANWPIAGAPEVRWVPFDRPGGRILLSKTERTAKAHALAHPARRAPATTARRHIVAQPRKLHALMAVGSLLSRELEAVTALAAVPEIQARMVGLFRRLAVNSKPSSPVADPPPSVWPATMAGTYSSCLRALSEVRNIGAGGAHAPLSELWELYEAWVAYSIRTALIKLIGPPQPHTADGSCLGRWADGDGVLELHYQAVIPPYRAGRREHGFSVFGERYVAAVGELRPDLLLVRSGPGETTAIIIDAKKRQAPVSTDDFTVSTSKYLWGVRRASKPDAVAAIQQCVLMAPLGGPVAPLPSGRANVLAAHPATPRPDEAIGRLLQSLRAEPAPDAQARSSAP
ncbi:hypothetical protein [Micromonospora haikouensis]|uniref:DUF2357 domain-containing protein n=1 Tax=Micromonospora haikouensis TaxID=686309 RepID=A0A0D0VV94_9ACTN|nr:hypothetical protein [Micromonospora haikouensis]KIR64603.1 hypothetical protein TK50_02855 [Micromonospora haikouensis]